MAGFLIEEHSYFGIDCTKAVWATDEMHEVYHMSSVALSDADFVVETENLLLLVEYKNANVSNALSHANKTPKFNPANQSVFCRIVRKFYDSLHYLRLTGKDKPLHYVLVVEYPNDDDASRRALRNKLKMALPFALQEHFTSGIKLIETVDVVNINEWNDHPIYGQFPMRPVSEA